MNYQSKVYDTWTKNKEKHFSFFFLSIKQRKHKKRGWIDCFCVVKGVNTKNLTEMWSFRKQYPGRNKLGKRAKYENKSSNEYYIWIWYGMKVL